ncbi:cell division protein FtsK [Enterococcus faecalis]
MKVYFFLAYLPFLVGIGFFCYLKVFPIVQPMVETKQYDWSVLIPIIALVTVSLLLPAVVIGLFFRYSRTHHGFMLWVNHRQTLGRMIIDNRYYLTKKHTSSGNGQKGTKEKITYFPKIYYQRKGGYIYVRFPLDLRNFQQQFLKKGQELEQAFKLDLTEEIRENGYICYKFLHDVKVNRINILDMQVVGNKIQLMKNLWWDIKSVPHALIVGGTGGGKTFFMYTLIYALLKMGAHIDICDPKKSDLKQLNKVRAFKGHVFWDAGIAKALKNAENLMNDRFEYMDKHSGTGLTDYEDCGFAPYFLIIDEWAAYYDSIEKDMQLLRQVLSSLTQIALKGRQSGVYLILGLQRPDQKYFDGGVRDGLGLRGIVGKISPTGFDMVNAGATNDKDFYNTNEKGRGYLDPGTSSVGEFYAPFIDKNTFNVFEEFGKFPEQEQPQLPKKENRVETEYSEEEGNISVENEG